MKSGLILLHKREGITSQRAVNEIKRLYGVSAAGHTGTLDPMATGVLPILIGRAVKASEYLICADKHYRAVMRLGVISDTEDAFGHCTPTNAPIPSEEEVMRAAEGFVGEIRQTPPMYSAIKIGGQKLMDLARRGIELDRPARDVTVFSLTCRKLCETEYALDVHCSKGTYIRTLCADIGKALGCGAVMAALCRTKAVGFTLEQCHTVEALQAMTEEGRESCVIPTEALFSSWPKVTLPPFFARLARAGVQIYLKKIRYAGEVGERVRLYDERGFFAAGEIRLFDGEAAIKPIKQFDI